MTRSFTVRPVRADDASAVAAIYNTYVLDTVATFEVVPVDAEEMGRRIAKVVGRGLPWVVAEDDARVADGGADSAVLGFAYAAPFRDRAAYDHTLETTVYVHASERGRAVGTALYAALFVALEELTPEQSPHAPIHALLGVLALPNEASVALHERFGMSQVAHLPAVGHKFGRRIDVGYWQVTYDA
ncbi:GNAT family N-acetyltransferase [Demequina sp.]|uniref:GNAT family N-acetyltransferase n=1 Tax=Demequina sp. TaxID=2050685 RepID=UPI0025C24BEF|nr:GNAT family N-acetyltransferase [Demequina sp.]